MKARSCASGDIGVAFFILNDDPLQLNLVGYFPKVVYASW